MKKLRFIVVIALTTGLALTANYAIAQRGQREMEERPRMMEQRDHKFLDLTPEQETKIKELRTKHIAEITPLKNELGEKQARLRTLQSVDKPDLNAINKIIDEMATIKVNIAKKNAAHRAAVASLLTPDQKVLFNARGQHKGGGKGNRMMGKGMNKGL